MRRKLVVCLFFFLLFVCTGCGEKLDGFLNQEEERWEVMADGEKEDRKENGQDYGEEEQNPGVTNVGTKDAAEGAEFLVLVDSAGTMDGADSLKEEGSLEKAGSSAGVDTLGEVGKLVEIAYFICDKMEAEYLIVSSAEKEKIADSIQKAEYILVGTDRQPLEFEFCFRNCIDEEVLENRKVGLFFLDLEEERDSLIEQFSEWYPGAVLLPEFSMSSHDDVEIEKGRVNGWLTTIYNLDGGKE